MTSAEVIALSFGIFFYFVAFQDENGVRAGGIRFRIALG
jgi:hypothetical protein